MNTSTFVNVKRANANAIVEVRKLLETLGMSGCKPDPGGSWAEWLGAFAPPTIHVCPACGGRLHVKSGKYGEFYGCGNYPTCRFTKSV